MSIGAVSTLRDVRANLLGFSEASASRLSGISLERLAELERGSGRPMSTLEADRLGRLYGLDEDVLVSQPLHIPYGEAVSALASIDEFHEVGDSIRARIVQAARAAKDIIRLRQILRLTAPVVPRIKAVEDPVPWKAGKLVAARARQEIGPNDEAPILSMKDWFRDHLSGVPLLYASLGDTGPAGLTFAGAQFGPAIVLNTDGKNVNPCVRRFSLAHELHHLLVDWDGVEPLATLSGYLEDTGFEREQRANSFAIRFLCPETNVSKLPQDDNQAVTVLIVKYGLHYAAARLYLINKGRGHSLAKALPADIHVTGAESDWERGEAPDGLDGFPVHNVPVVRRTHVARLAAQAYSMGLIQRDALAEFLDVTPIEKLESVLALFGFDPPEELAGAA